MARLLVLLLVSSPLFAQSEDVWHQWGGGPRHAGTLAVYGQSLRTAMADVIYDPFVPQELEEAGGALLVHYQTPLSDRNEVFMEVKGGTYVNRATRHTQTWSIRKYEWIADQLVERWTAESDWKPVPAGSTGFEPVFHAALSSNYVYMPAAGGTILEVSRVTGAIVRRLGQFGATDPNTYVTGPLAIAEDQTIFYNTIKLPATNTWTGDHEGAWLVRVTPDGNAIRRSYQELVPGAPAATAQCTNAFPAEQLPWPPSPNAVAPTVTCGSQRAGLNVGVALGSDGTVYTASRTHQPRASRWGWVVAVNRDLTPKWATSLRNRFNDGCNVLLPPNGVAGGCRAGATTGVDPSDNQPGSGIINDDSTASPVVAPDGSIYLGTYSRYNHSQGHTVRVSSTGAFLAAYPFGWDVTPALYEHDGTFSVVTKENRYVGVGTYCGDPKWCPTNRVPGDDEGYYITQLDPSLHVQWKFKSTNTETCTRLPNGELNCVDDRPEGFEWCVNALAVDRRGVVYVNSEDGHLYAINQGGTLRDRLFLQLSLGAAYTPLSLGADGKIYTQNAGHLFAVGSNAPRRRAVGKGF